jgi:hypothetical protein
MYSGKDKKMDALLNIFHLEHKFGDRTNINNRHLDKLVVDINSKAI